MGQPDLLLVLKKGQRPPKNREEFLQESANLLQRLTEEASPGEIADANRRLEMNLPEEEQLGLPPGLLNNPKTARALMTNPASEGSNLHSWKVQAGETLESNPEPMSEQMANQMASELSLESCLSRFL